MTVAEYEAAFARLERFTQAFDSEEKQVNRFLEGLQLSLRVKVMGCRCTTVADMVQMASHFEDEYQQYLRGRSKGKTKTSFASRFSFSSPPSSSGTSSLGKRKKDRYGGSSARHILTKDSRTGSVSGAQHNFARVSSTIPNQAASSGQGSAQCF